MTTMTSEPTLAPRKIKLQDRNGQPVLDYDTDSGEAVLHLPEATLRIRSVEGKIELTSNRDISLQSTQTIEIKGKRGLRLEGEGSRLQLQKKSEITAPSLKAGISKLSFEGEELSGKAKEATFSWGRVHQTVTRFVQFAKSAYTRVETVLHTRAGRVRTEAEGSLQLHAEEARVLAKRDVHVNGRSINLG